MKYVVIVPDGAADYPLEILGNRTPMEAAETPCMDALVRAGQIGRVRNVPPGFVPSSDVANLSLLGYEPEHYYVGRGPLEAANLGIVLGNNDLALRCNLITENDGVLRDYSAGHITNKEASVIMKYLDKALGSEDIRFYPGKSYRNLMVYREGAATDLDKIKYWAPHDIMGKKISEYLPNGENSGRLVDLMLKSRELLAEHEINKVRIDLGENPANMIWLWGCGKNPNMESFEEKFKIKGGVISAVDLINGIGKLIKLEVIPVEGVTGYYDTNYEGKAREALKALRNMDFVFVHIEATDEASHNQDLRMKIACLERIDRMVVKTITEEMEGTEYRILIAPDHPTPISKRTHTDEPVPFLISGSGIEPSGAESFSEPEAQNSSLYFESGARLLRYFLQK